MPAMRPLRGRIRPRHVLPRALRGWLTACCGAWWGTNNAPARAVLPSLCPVAPAGISLHQSWMWLSEPRSPGQEQGADGVGCPPSPLLGWGCEPV